jgi:hypothetical protein
MDITYIPMAKDFVYLVVVLDWFLRRLPRACQLLRARRRCLEPRVSRLDGSGSLWAEKIPVFPRIQFFEILGLVDGDLAIAPLQGRSDGNPRR